MNYIHLIPPIKKGDNLGHILLMQDGVNIASFDLTALNDVDSLTFGEKIYHYFKIFI